VLTATVALAVSPVGPRSDSAGAVTLPWHYVSASTGSDAGNDCTDQYAPCATIQHAIDESHPGDEIVVRAGTYDEQLVLDMPLTLRGPNSRLDSRDPEAVIEGGDGIAITAEASNTTISGLTISTDDFGTPIRTAGAEVNRLWITNNIIEGGISGVWLGADGARTEIGFNVIRGDAYGIRLGAASFSELTIRHNFLKGPASSYAVFAGAGTEVDGFELWGDEFARASLDASIADGFIEANKIKPPTGGVGLRANLTKSYVSGNSFQGEGEASCLQLLGSQGGLDPSSRVLVLENEFAGCMPDALRLGPEAEKITVTANTFPGSYDGIVADGSYPWNLTGSGITVYGNRLVGLTHLGVDNAAAGELNARDNWWGCNGGPGTIGCDSVSSGVDASPNVVLTAEALKVGDPSAAMPVNTLDPGEKAWIRTYLKDGDGGEALNVSIITDTPVSFSSPNGTFVWASSGWGNAEASTVFTAGSQPGPAQVVVTMDNQQVVLPLTIRGSLPALPSPPTPAPPPSKGSPSRPEGPRILIPGNALNLSGRNAVIGTLSCARSACRVDRRSAEARVGRMRFDVRLKTPTDIAAENIAQIRAILPEGALRQLSLHGTGTLVITIKMTDASDGVASTTRRVKIEGVTGATRLPVRLLRPWGA